MHPVKLAHIQNLQQVANFQKIIDIPNMFGRRGKLWKGGWDAVTIK